MKPIEIRWEEPADRARIREVTEQAFRGALHTCGREHLLVDALREAGALALSLVAVSERGIVGHVAASLVTVSEATGEWFGLGPLSVLPACQRQGIGSQLMAAVLSQLQRRGARGCVLVGDPAYYRRFGFRSDATLVVPEVPPEVSLSVRFVPCADRGVVEFHRAFTAALAGPGATPKEGASPAADSRP